jgi:hypothetical protein
MTVFRQGTCVNARKSKNESQSVSQENVRQLQDHSPPWGGESDLHQSKAQTAARLNQAGELRAISKQSEEEWHA